MKLRRPPTASEAPPVDAVERTRILAMVSILLGYPDRELLDQLPVLAAGASSLDGPAGTALARFVEHLATSAADQLAAAYVDTFDMRRRCCLYLTYYAHGDTRKRGAALVRFTLAYRSAGLPPPEGELADHLGVICNFAALAPGPGTELLAGHRAGIELLRLALADHGSPYLDVVDALVSVLPPASQTDLDRATTLARSGPPAEDVGLEPFGPPELMGGRR